MITREGEEVKNMVVNTCRCGKSQTKAPMKRIDRPPAAMYKNDEGTSFALSYLASLVAKYMGRILGPFTLDEVDGHLVINTGMTRDTDIEAMIAEHACKQPCDGSCEERACDAGVGGL